MVTQDLQTMIKCYIDKPKKLREHSYKFYRTLMGTQKYKGISAINPNNLLGIEITINTENLQLST